MAKFTGRPPTSKTTRSLINRGDLEEMLIALIEEEIEWHVGSLRAIAKNIAQATEEAYDDSYEKVQELLFIESDTNSLICAAKSAGAIEELNRLAERLGITPAVPDAEASLVEWAHIINPSE